MSNLVINEYAAKYAKQVTDLFYDAVYSISPSIYTLEQKQAWAPKPIDYEYWQKRLAVTKPFLMLTNELVVGFIELEESGHIDCLYVKPNFQKQGVASLLLTHVISIANEKSLESLYVEVSIVAKPLFKLFDFFVEKENKIIRNEVVLTNYTMRKQL